MDPVLDPGFAVKPGSKNSLLLTNNSFGFFFLIIFEFHAVFKSIKRRLSFFVQLVGNLIDSNFLGNYLGHQLLRPVGSGAGKTAG